MTVEQAINEIQNEHDAWEELYTHAKDSWCVVEKTIDWEAFIEIGKTLFDIKLKKKN